MNAPNGPNSMWTAIKEFYAVPFRVAAFFMKHYVKNRERVKTLMRRPRMAVAFQGAIVLTVVVWVAVGLMASDEDRSRLTRAVQDFWADTQALSEEKQRRDREADAPGTEAVQ